MKKLPVTKIKMKVMRQSKGLKGICGRPCVTQEEVVTLTTLYPGRYTIVQDASGARFLTEPTGKTEGEGVELRVLGVIVARDTVSRILWPGEQATIEGPDQWEITTAHSGVVN